ncbi:MAG: radical SAM protein [Terracidiphilus sp.]|jgi:threonylcarbamoyladenosine tRNA methylthiotransferase MtaB
MSGFHIENFGCRAARADGEAIGSHLRTGGLAESAFHAADLVVVNTCSVTAEADRAARAFIRRVHRQNPAAKIVVTGCYAQRAPDEVADMPGVAAVVGNSHKALAPRIAFELLHPSEFLAADTRALIQIAEAPLLNPVETGRPRTARAASAPPQVVWADDRFAHSFLEQAPLAFGTQTRPNLKIQEGCSNRCTFCVIPQTRGPSRSLPYAVVLRQIQDFVAAGGKELVLSGINLGRWGRDSSSGLGPKSLAGLVRAIFERTELPRLRLSSIEPMDWDSDLIALMREFGGGRLARHAHLPLQSGSDAVLRRMHRRYRPWHYAEKIEALLQAAGPDLTLGADVMTGFPGETDSEFEETLDFLRALPLGYLHLFPFSPRPGTPGWALHAAAPVPSAVIEERMAALRILAAEKTRAHRSRFLGRTLRIITLQTAEALAAKGCTASLSENFLPVEVVGLFPANQLVQAQVTGLSPHHSLRAFSLR